MLKYIGFLFVFAILVVLLFFFWATTRREKRELKKYFEKEGSKKL